MEQRPWKANSSSAIQEIPRILWEQDTYYSMHKCSHPSPILNQKKLVYMFLFYLFKINLNLLFPPVTRSFKWHLILGQITRTAIKLRLRTCGMRRRVVWWLSFVFFHNLLPPSSWYYPLSAAAMSLAAKAHRTTLWAFITITTLPGCW